MADRIELFDVTVIAGTAQATPQNTAMPFNLGRVTDVEILVPPGCSGLVGFQLTHSGEPVIPYNRTKWVIADGEVIKWPLRGMPVGSAWSLRAYNTDIYDHTLHLRFLVDEVERQSEQSIEVLDIAPIAPAAIEEES